MGANRRGLKPKVIHPFVTATFDIETTALDASYGRLLCCCIKLSSEEKVRSIVAPTKGDEPKALREIVRVLVEEADILVGWNSIRFDLAFLNARLFQYEMTKIPTKWHIDLMYQCQKLRTRGNSLDGAARDARLPVMKHNVSAWEWVEAAMGSTKAEREASMNEIVKHCVHDVLMTEQMLLKYKPFIAQIQRKG